MRRHAAPYFNEVLWGCVNLRSLILNRFKVGGDVGIAFYPSQRRRARRQRDRTPGIIPRVFPRRARRRAMPPKHNAKAQQKQDDRKIKELLRGANQKRSGHWRDTWVPFCEHMRTLGLKIRDVKPDGNCMFRSFSDQMDGHEEKHEYYRHGAVDFMAANSDDFAPFVECDFALYCRKMRQDAAWGGNLELQALSMAYRTNISIHQLDAPRFEIRNAFDGDQAVYVCMCVFLRSIHETSNPHSSRHRIMKSHANMSCHSQAHHPLVVPRQ